MRVRAHDGRLAAQPRHPAGVLVNPPTTAAEPLSIAGTSGDAALELAMDPAVSVLRLHVPARRRSRPLGALTRTAVGQVRDILNEPAGSGFVAVPSPPDGHVLLYVERREDTATLTVASSNDHARTFGPVSVHELDGYLERALPDALALP